jgi:hypothetical protein
MRKFFLSSLLTIQVPSCSAPFPPHMFSVFFWLDSAALIIFETDRVLQPMLSSTVSG